jgi:hypothetical protein
MTTLETCLFQLLLKHDCVVVPNFGGFVAKHSAAKILDNGTLLPPSKSFTFNKLLKQNDGLLINSFATQANISYELSQESIANELALWNLVLEGGQRLLLDRIGYFVNDANNNLYFNADTTNFSLSSYGLPIISFERIRELLEPIVQEFEKSIIRAVQTERETKQDYSSPILAFDTNIVPVSAEEKNSISQQKPKKSRTRFVKYAAAATIVLPIAFYTYWIPTHTNILQSGIITLSDFNPFHEVKKVESKNKSALKVKIDIAQKTEKIIVESNSISVTSNIVKEDTIDRVNLNQPKVILDKGNFDLIVGSFNSKENAENFVAKLRSLGYENPTISSVNTMYRVSAGTTKNVQALQPIATSLNEIGIETWILRK